MFAYRVPAVSVPSTSARVGGRDDDGEGDGDDGNVLAKGHHAALPQHVVVVVVVASSSVAAVTAVAV